jgi:pimeloyl-ACP methyl ester carboxylesterase
MTKIINVLSGLGLPTLPSQSADTIAALLWAREAMQKHLTTTYAVQNPKGIEELKQVKIGGVDQWLHIRGRNRDNPVLLYLHGGPGGPMIGSADAIQRPWEDYFTVVQWDQRQTGKSYYPANDETDPLTVEQFIRDTEEVILFLRRHLKQDKLFVLGHSWGSVLGMHIMLHFEQ